MIDMVSTVVGVVGEEWQFVVGQNYTNMVGISTNWSLQGTAFNQVF
ncbi:MAG: hypothetical protein ACXW1Z_05540 [Methylobacter sp.]